MFATEGIPGMFKGYSLNIIKGPITLSLSLTTYDLLRGVKFAPRDQPPLYHKKIVTAVAPATNDTTSAQQNNSNNISEK